MYVYIPIRAPGQSNYRMRDVFAARLEELLEVIRLARAMRRRRRRRRGFFRRHIGNLARRARRRLLQRGSCLLDLLAWRSGLRFWLCGCCRWRRDTTCLSARPRTRRRARLLRALGLRRKGHLLCWTSSGGLHAAFPLAARRRWLLLIVPAFVAAFAFLVVLALLFTEVYRDVSCKLILILIFVLVIAFVSAVGRASPGSV